MKCDICYESLLGKQIFGILILFDDGAIKNDKNQVCESCTAKIESYIASLINVH